MSRSRRRALLLTVLLAVGLRAGHAAPALAAAQVRAVACCAAHEKAAPPVREAERCCQIASDAGDPTLPGAGHALPPPLLSGAVTLPVGVPALALALVPLARTGDRATGPPRYLRLLTLLR
ncbi:MAG: hypothetical protein KIT14_14655 [bacterium]|nr:hypothetical protein [bacterium]